MCGIAGYVGRPREGLEDVFKVFMGHLLVETSSRGTHATGIAAWTGGMKSIIGKGPVSAANFLKVPVWKTGLGAPSMIAHCRYATHGSPGKNENNHPFEQGRWALIHNGVIGGYREIAKAEGVTLSTECDSEVILRVFAKGAGKKNDPVAGLQRWADAGAKESGRYAVALLDRTNGSIRLLRSNDYGSPCAILRLPKLGIVAFASTAKILSDAFDATFKEFPELSWGEEADAWDCVPNRIYVLRPETLEVEHEEIETRSSNYSGTSQSMIGFRPSGRSTGVWDSNRGTATVDDETRYLCPRCGQPDCECANGQPFEE